MRKECRRGSQLVLIEKPRAGGIGARLVQGMIRSNFGKARRAKAADTIWNIHTRWDYLKYPFGLIKKHTHREKFRCVCMDYAGVCSGRIFRTIWHLPGEIAQERQYIGSTLPLGQDGIDRGLL